MKDLDPFIVVYTITGIVIVCGVFIVLSLFTEGVRSINAKVKEEEDRKKEEEKRRRAA